MNTRVKVYLISLLRSVRHAEYIALEGADRAAGVYDTNATAVFTEAAVNLTNIRRTIVALGRHVVDTKTGVEYESKSAAANAVAAEYGIEPSRYAWYSIVKADPKRFVQPLVIPDALMGDIER